MTRIAENVKQLVSRLWASFSFVGMATATLFLAASLTPSLLPRPFVVQGALSGFALAVGYGVGVLLVAVWLFLEIPKPPNHVQQWSKRITTAAVAAVVLLFLWRDVVWQNSLRKLMEMPPVETAYPWRVAAIALLVGVAIIAVARAVRCLWRFVDRKVSAVIPRRISVVVSALLVTLGLMMLVNDVFARLALDAADAVFLEMDMLIEEGIEQPEEAVASGSSESLIEWGTIGRRGKQFIAAGPTEDEINAFWNKPVTRPLRVYVGLASRETSEERAKLALEELRRIGAFERKVLIIATPTGTGWLDPGAVDPIEYLHAGDTAIVSAQYSYLPSWITILVDPTRSQDSATALFDEVYHYWKTLPKESRPKLYVYGLSLGALGSAASADLFTVFEDPIQGGVWSGPPFPSAAWGKVTRYRNPDSPMWLPRFRDGSMLRFTGLDNSLGKFGERWGPMRFVYIQHASDPMTFFSPDLLYSKPDWLVGERGPDVSPYLRWYPIVTFLQIAFDLPMATSIPDGYGHNYSPASYINSWIEVTQPELWSEADTQRLKEAFAETTKPDVQSP